jgi:hypothetical protein
MFSGLPIFGKVTGGRKASSSRQCHPLYLKETGGDEVITVIMLYGMTPISSVFSPKIKSNGKIGKYLIS